MNERLMHGYWIMDGWMYDGWMDELWKMEDGRWMDDG
jgi:hypothetical protein